MKLTRKMIGKTVVLKGRHDCRRYEPLVLTDFYKSQPTEATTGATMVRTTAGSAFNVKFFYVLEIH
jgi:hypothetical protein